jgi:hypothetical protein
VDLVLGAGPSGAARYDDGITGLQRVLRYALTAQPTRVAPFGRERLLASFSIAAGEYQDRVRAAELEFLDYALERD